MGRSDTGLNNKTQENEVISNPDLDQPAVEEDSDNDLEDYNASWGDYMPLAQNPNDGEPLYESEDDEDFSALAEARAESNSSLIKEVWAKPSPKEVDIDMSDNKIDLVKEVMSKIHLPTESIPVWAKNIPEDEWKHHLLQKLNK